MNFGAFLIVAGGIWIWALFCYGFSHVCTLCARMFPTQHDNCTKDANWFLACALWASIAAFGTCLVGILFWYVTV